jgi:hypothetical protein
MHFTVENDYNRKLIGAARLRQTVLHGFGSSLHFNVAFDSDIEFTLLDTDFQKTFLGTSQNAAQPVCVGCLWSICTFPNTACVY